MTRPPVEHPNGTRGRVRAVGYQGRPGGLSYPAVAVTHSRVVYWRDTITSGSRWIDAPASLAASFRPDGTAGVVRMNSDYHDAILTLGGSVWVNLNDGSWTNLGRVWAKA